MKRWAAAAYGAFSLLVAEGTTRAATCTGSQPLMDSVVFLQSEDPAGKIIAHGTGTIVDVSGSNNDVVTILTALHVVSYAVNVTVVASSCLPATTQKLFRAAGKPTPLRIDADRDLALFSIKLGAGAGAAVPHVAKFSGPSPNVSSPVSFVTAAGLESRFITATNIGAALASNTRLFLVGMQCPSSLQGQAAACGQLAFRGKSIFDIYALPASVSRGYSGSPVYYNNQVLAVVDQLAYGPKAIAVSLSGFSLTTDQPPPSDFKASPQIFAEYAVSAGDSNSWAIAAAPLESGCSGITEVGYALDQLRTSSRSVSANGLAANALDQRSLADIASTEAHIRSLATGLPAKCRGRNGAVDLLLGAVLDALNAQRQLGSMRTLWSFVRDSFVQPGSFGQRWGRLTFGKSTILVSPLEDSLRRYNPLLPGQKVSSTSACDVLGGVQNTGALRGTPTCSDPVVEAEWQKVILGLPDVTWVELVSSPDVQATLQSRIAASSLTDPAILLAWAAGADVQVLRQRSTIVSNVAARVDSIAANLDQNSVRASASSLVGQARLRTVTLKTIFNSLPASFRTPVQGLDQLLAAFANEDVLRTALRSAHKNRSTSDIDDTLIATETQIEETIDALVVGLIDAYRLNAQTP